MIITGVQRQTLTKAILSAFPRPSDLQRMVSFQLDQNLHAIAGGNNLETTVFDLIIWAEAQGRLMELIEATYRTVPGNPLLRDFVQEIGKEVLASGTPADIEPDKGPAIFWRGPSDELQLQSFLKPTTDLLDVGFLVRALRQIMSVCRIEVPATQSYGTAFLVAPTLVLTNYHVLKPEQSGNIELEACTRDVVLQFGGFTQSDGLESSGYEFRLHESQPLLKYSVVDELDYALLRVEGGIKSEKRVRPVSLGPQAGLGQGMAMHILQHPEGGAMKLAVSSDGIVGVYPDIGRVQYVTTAKAGSSGSPCFNDKWQVVAVHHAQKARAFGSIREGILINTIYSDISQHL